MDTDNKKQSQPEEGTFPARKKLSKRWILQMVIGSFGQVTAGCLHAYFLQNTDVSVGLVRLAAYFIVIFSLLFFDGMVFMIFRKSFIDRLLIIKEKKKSAESAGAEIQQEGEQADGIIRFLPVMGCIVILFLIGIGIVLSGNDTGLIVGEWHSEQSNIVALTWTFYEDGNGTFSGSANGIGISHNFNWEADKSFIEIRIPSQENGTSFDWNFRYRYTVTANKLILEKAADKRIEDLLGVSLGKSKMTLYKEGGS